jgi:hypothetical protein
LSATTAKSASRKLPYYDLPIVQVFNCSTGIVVPFLVLPSIVLRVVIIVVVITTLPLLTMHIQEKEHKMTFESGAITFTACTCTVQLGVCVCVCGQSCLPSSVLAYIYSKGEYTVGFS